MQSYMSLIAITGALAAGAMSPGPSFLFVARNSIALSRNHGLATAGYGIRLSHFYRFSFDGITGFIGRGSFCFLGFSVLGGLYLCYIAFKTLRSARLPMSHELNSEVSRMTLRKTISFGLLTRANA